ncbi:MAG TPA: hypothetical protein VLT61_02710 [Anaeromyxobacteraceae bacterium]|nr:hypothetical protein [Anaeromyxobacteraceae bacterium]
MGPLHQPRTSASSAANDLPDAATIGRAAYPKYDAASTRTGRPGVACNSKGELLARLVAVKPWRGLGRDQLVAAFDQWVIDPDTNEPLEFAQACGRNSCEVVLLESVGGDLRVVARGRAEAGCDALDLAPYRMKHGETLIGVRGRWVNHGFGDTTLTLLRVEGKQLRAVFAQPVDVETPDMDEEGVVTMVPRGDGPADIQIRYARRGEPAKKLSPRTEVYRWDGNHYAPKRRSSR